MKKNGFGMIELLIMLVIIVVITLIVWRGTLYAPTSPETPNAQRGENDIQAARNLVKQINHASSAATEQRQVDNLSY